MERRRDGFDQAERDFEHSRGDAERGSYEWSCFSSHQAAERDLRAVFQRMGAEAWGRPVADLLKELGKALPLVRVVLFGSYATGTYTVGSDVDVLIVYGGERREDAYATSRRALDLPGLESHVCTEAEHAQLQGALDRMCASGVVLYPRAEHEP